MLYFIYLSKATIFILLFFLTQVTLSKHVKGKLNTSENWSYLDKFCFQSDNGSISFDIKYDLNLVTPTLLFYDELEIKWPDVYKSEKTCQEKSEKANQIIALNDSQCDLEISNNEGTKYRCHGSRSFISSGKRWWFIAISNCGSTKGLSLTYSLTMTNGFSFWYKHFSADEFFILRTYLAALCIDIVLLFLSIVAYDGLNSRQLLHKIYRLYMTALVIQSIGLTFLSTHYIYYGISGAGSFDIKVIGSILLRMSYLMSVTCLLMVGRSSKILLTIFMTAFCSTSLAFFFYEQQQQEYDPGLDVHIYESPLGYVVMTMRCVAWLIFLDGCRFNVKKTPERRSFYYPLVLVYTPWFLSSPIAIIGSHYFIDGLEREKVISLVEIGVSIIGHVFFLIITGSNLTNESLEKHARPSQVMAADIDQFERSETGTKSLDIIHPGNKHVTFKSAKSDIFTVPGFKEMLFQSDGTTNIFYQQQQGDQTTTFMASRQKGRELRNSLQTYNPNLPQLMPPNDPLHQLSYHS